MVQQKSNRRRKGQGEASVWQQGDRWRGAVSLGNGKRVYRRGRTADEVRQALRKLQAQVDSGLSVPSATRTVKQTYEEWMQARDFRRATRVNYSYLFERHILPHVASTPLVKLTPANITRLYRKLQNAGTSASVLAHLHRALGSMLTWAFRQEHVGRVATRQVEKPREPVREMMCLDLAGARAFLRACEGHRHEALFNLLLGAGLRIGEALALRWCDLDLENGTVSVTRTLSVRRGGVEIGEPKTRAGRRTVSIPVEVADKLRTHRAAMSAESIGGQTGLDRT